MTAGMATLARGKTTHAFIAVWLVATLTWLGAHVEAVSGRPLTVIWAADPGQYDPHNTSHPVAQDVFRHVCEPLFYGDYDGSVHGLLAEDEVEFGAEGRRLSVRLRPGITFHDGSALDAEAVRLSFERLRRTGISPLAEDLKDIGIAAGSNGRTVVFELPRPNYEFVRLTLANPYAAIVSPRAGNPEPPGFVACTGPYRFVPELYQPGSSIGLARWRDYEWPRSYFENRGAARIQRLGFAFIAERSERFANLVQGPGCALSVSREQVSEIASRPAFRLHHTMGGLTYLGYNFQRSRWQDPRVRKAVALALDKAALRRLGPFLVADTPLTPDAVGYDPRASAFGYGYDPERSRILLGESEVDPKDEVVLLVPESNTYADLAAEIREQLGAVGLANTRVRTVPRADILSRRQDFDLLLFDYAWGDYTALGIFLGPGPRNLLGYPDDDVSRLVDEALATARPDARREIILAAQRTVLERALWQPLVVRQIAFAVDGRCLDGERLSPEGELMFHDASTK